MTGIALELVVQQAFGLAVLLLLPLVAAAAISSTAAAVLAARVGVHDATVTLVARALAVVLTIGLTMDTLTAQTVAFTAGLWDQLADAGRTENS